MATLTEGVAAMQKVAVELTPSAGRAVTEATAELRALVTVNQGRAGASNGRLRGVGMRGARIGVRSAVKGTYGAVWATGPAHLLDHPTKAHSIAPRRKRALNTPSGPRASVQHPGTRGTFYFEQAVAEFEPRAVAIFAKYTEEALVAE